MCKSSANIRILLIPLLPKPINPMVPGGVVFQEEIFKPEARKLLRELYFLLCIHLPCKATRLVPWRPGCFRIFNLRHSVLRRILMTSFTGLSGGKSATGHPIPRSRPYLPRALPEPQGNCYTPRHPRLSRAYPRKEGNPSYIR